MKVDGLVRQDLDAELRWNPPVVPRDAGPIPGAALRSASGVSDVICNLRMRV
jgi:hypothetical protein